MTERSASWLVRLREALASSGLNHVGVVSRRRYDEAAPERLRASAIGAGFCRGVIVTASGGPMHWDRFLEHLAEDPIARLAREAHPLDAFARGILERAAPLLGEGGAPYLVVQPTFNAPLKLDFVRLGELAGLGVRSELPVLLSPVYGPWFAFRAAIFTAHDLDDSEPTDAPLPPCQGSSPCQGCPAPCRTAAPAAIPGLTSLAERERLGARMACVVAPRERYTDLQALYHYDHAAGRRALYDRFGLETRASEPTACKIGTK